jgi:GTP cyclohydrolase IA
MKNVTDIKHKILEQISKEEAEKAIKTILKYIGEDPNREGLVETPKRVIKAFEEYFGGYLINPDNYLEKTFGDVEGYSHCEHHMAPIIGVVHVAYIPSEKVVGLSKLARVVDAYARRLQTQERLTMQIANSIFKGLKSHGSAVSIDAEHQCMTTRGIRKEGATTITNYFTGVFRDSQNLQKRFLTYIKD